MHTCKVYGLPSQGLEPQALVLLEQNLKKAFSHVPQIGGLSEKRQPLVFFPTDRLQFSEDTNILVEIDLDGQLVEKKWPRKEDVFELLCNFLTIPFRLTYAYASLSYRVQVDGSFVFAIDSPGNKRPRLAAAS